MDAAFALEVLDKAPYVTVSFTRPNGTPYGVPLSLARTDDKTFYFHCALEGDKLDCIAANAVGKAEMVTDRNEKIEALRAIYQRFLPDHMDALPYGRACSRSEEPMQASLSSHSITAFDDAIARSLERTAVVKIILTEPPTGKRKQYNKEGEEMTNEQLNHE